MPEPNEKTPATVPEQPDAKPPLRKSMPVVIALVVILGLIGIANLSSLLSGNKKNAPTSAMPMRPAAPNAQQVNSFESQQQLQAQRDAEARQHQQELNAAFQQLQQTEGTPGPEAAGAPPMTAAQRAAIYGDSPNAPQRTSNMSQAQAEAKQKELAKEKQQQDAINSDTVAIDFEHTTPTVPTPGLTEAAQGAAATAASGAAPVKPTTTEAKADNKGNAMGGYGYTYATNNMGVTLNYHPNFNLVMPLYVHDPSLPGGRAINFNAFTVATDANGNPIEGDFQRNGARGFDAVQADLALQRTFPIVERLHLQFRAEAFNLLNHPIFGAINSNLQSGPALFGIAAQTQNSALGGLSPLYQVGGPRSLQMALKLQF